MRWDGPPGWGSLEVPLTRLTMLESFDCGVPRGIPIAAVDVSGAWFDPAHNGGGFTFEQLDAATIASIWYGFDAAHDPIWMSGVLHRGVDVPTFIGTYVQGLGPLSAPATTPAPSTSVPKARSMWRSSARLATRLLMPRRATR